MANGTQCSQCGTQLDQAPTLILKPFCDAVCMKQYSARHEYEKGGRSRTNVTLLEPLPSKTPPTGAIRKAYKAGDNQAVIEAIRACCDIVGQHGCWEWQTTSADAYASMTIGNATIFVHRLSLEAKLGKKLGKQAAHHMCANTICVNPDHLQPVTAAENTAEMLARTYMVSRIADLECELARLDPTNSLLSEVSVSA